MAIITLTDVALRDCSLSHDLVEMKAAYFRASPEICTERAQLVTRYSVAAGLGGRQRVSVLEKARLYRRVLETRVPVVWHARAFASTPDGMTEFSFEDRSPFAGSTTSKFKGVPLYPEFLALALWPELWTMSTRGANPYQITEAEANVLNSEVFPYWMDRTIVEVARVDGTPAERAQIQLLQKFVFFIASKANCISHTVPDFSRAVNEGLRAVIDKAAKRAANAVDDGHREFYEALVEVMEGIVAYARRLGARASSLAGLEADPARRVELERIAEIYARIPEFPSRSFRDGLTAIWLCWVAVHLENPNVGLSVGRLDQVLYDLYRADIDAGVLTPDQAVELVSHLWLKFGDHVPTVPAAGEQLFGGSGSNQAITIGGVDAQGRDAVNDLTYVMLRATELMMLRDPNLNARYCAGVNSDAYLRRLCDANVETGATPALHNDRAVIASLTAKGHTLEQARDYAIIGCVEPGSNGRAYGATGSLLINLPSALEMAVFSGAHRHTGLDQRIGPMTGEPASFRTFDEFFGALELQIGWLLDQAVATNNLLGRTHQKIYPTPILSSLFIGPMESGRDLIEGGAEINSSGVAIIGLADVVDSVSAIQRFVFERRDLTLPQFVDILLADYVGHEALRTRLRDPLQTPRFGTDNQTAQMNADRIVRTIDGLLSGKSHYRGGFYTAGYWSMTNHAGFGRLMKATPNGRRAGESFSSGITPVSGVTPGLTATLNAVASLPARCIANGMAFNLKYTPDDGDRGRMLDNFVATVEGYFDDLDGTRDGGMEIQFNVTSRATLLDAIAHPENHPELLVRVSGYTAYFKDLNPQMQREILDRTEYRLSTGRALEHEPIALAAEGARP